MSLKMKIILPKKKKKRIIDMFIQSEKVLTSGYVNLSAK